jgi:hypothetical protein
MTKFTKLALMGASTILITAGFIITGVVAAASSSGKPVKSSAVQHRDTVIVEKPVYLKPDTVRIPVQCKKFHCESSLKSKPKPADDSIIINQITPQ